MLVHWIWLATRQGLSKQALYELIRQCGDPEAVYRASEEALRTVPGVTNKGLASVKEKALEPSYEILNHCRENEIHLLTLEDEKYPRRLRGIQDPPILLFYRGSLPNWEAQPVIGAVGTRHCSQYGIRSGQRLGEQLTLCGGCVVSGMAEGIDTAVLRGVLAAKGSPVIFLAGGVDVIYPAENRSLYQEILTCGGCVLSEQPPGVKPSRWRFPVRNRLISGISNAVLVVEAPEKSGALITARHALNQGRQVYVVPGPIDVESCQGTNALLKTGAQIAQNGWDILVSCQDRYPGLRDRTKEAAGTLIFGVEPAAAEKKTVRKSSNEKKVIDNGRKQPYIDVEKKAAVRSPAEQAIVSQLLSGPRLTDAVIYECGLSKSEALAAMTMLELQGVVHRLPGNLMALNE